MFSFTFSLCSNPPIPTIPHTLMPIIRASPNKYESHRKGEGKSNRASYPAHSNGGVAARANGTLESTKSKRNTLIRQSASHGNLTDEQTMDFLYNTGDRGQVKRTKSFWKFGKSDTEDIVEGMAMWKHRDLIQPEHELRMEEERIRETTLKRNKNKAKPKSREQQQQDQEKSKGRSASTGRVKEMQQNITVPIIDDHAKYQLTKAEIDQRIGKTKERYYQEDVVVGKSAERNNGKVVRDSETELGYAEDEEDMAMEDSLEEGANTLVKKGRAQNMRMKAYEGGNANLNNKQQQPNKYYDDMNMDMDERFYDDESLTQEVVVMKTLNRKEILKQYYSSGTSDTERHSSSSDPYDCIVVQDHHVMRNKNNIFNNNSTNNRKNNKNKEMTTFRGEFATTTTNKNNNSKSMMDQEHTATILPRTKLVKSSADQSMEKVGTGKKSRDATKPSDHHQAQKKKPQNVDPTSNDKRKNFEESKRNSLSSAKSYGPWYDLWGANPNNSPNNHNNTLISQK